jgi:hypothetical protein
MDNLTVPENMVVSLRQRRADGERLGVLARELGLSWQRLWGLLYRPGPAEDLPALLTSQFAPATADMCPTWAGRAASAEQPRRLHPCVWAPR